MHYFALALAALSALATVNAAPAIEVASAAPVVPANYYWNVTNWHASCVGGNCQYRFDVAAPKFKDSPRVFPGFKAHCSGSDTGVFRDCNILASEGGPKIVGGPFAQGSLRPKQQGGVAKMAVSLGFSNRNANGDVVTYNYTGSYKATYNGASSDGSKFAVIPSKATAVA